MLYRIEGTGIKIAGTAHAFTIDKPDLPGWLRSVFERSDRLIVETDFEAMDPAAELLGANQSLTVLSFFDLISASWQRLQIPDRASQVQGVGGECAAERGVVRGRPHPAWNNFSCQRRNAGRSRHNFWTLQRSVSPRSMPCPWTSNWHGWNIS